MWKPHQIERIINSALNFLKPCPYSEECKNAVYIICNNNIKTCQFYKFYLRYGEDWKEFGVGSLM
jgi:hypothetical protein